MSIQGAKQFLLDALPGLTGEQLIRASQAHSRLCGLVVVEVAGRDERIGLKERMKR